MSSNAAFSPHEQLKSVSPETLEVFRSLRDTVFAAGPLTPEVLEFVLIGAFTTSGNDVALKAHATRLLEAGIDKAAIHQAVLVTLAATAPFIDVTRALKWIDEAAESFAARQ